jgi:hypothetical protein
MATTTGGTTASSPSIFYVTKSGVDGTTRDGSQTAPFLTLGYAVSRVAASTSVTSTINVGAGTYNERLYIPLGKRIDVIGAGSSGTNATAIGGVNDWSVHIAASYCSVQNVKVLKPVSSSTFYIAHITGTENLNADINNIAFTNVDFGSTETGMVRGVSVNTAGVNFTNCLFPSTTNYSVGMGSARGVNFYGCTFPIQQANAWGNIGIFPSAQVPISNPRYFTQSVNLSDSGNVFPASCVIHVQPGPYAKLSAGADINVAVASSPEAAGAQVLLPDSMKYKYYLKLKAASGSELALTTAQAAGLAPTSPAAALAAGVYISSVCNVRILADPAIASAANTQAAQIQTGLNAALGANTVASYEYVRTNLANGLAFNDSDDVVPLSSAEELSTAVAALESGAQISLAGVTSTIVDDEEAAVGMAAGANVVIGGELAKVATVTSVGTQLNAAAAAGQNLVMDIPAATTGDEVAVPSILTVAAAGVAKTVTDAAGSGTNVTLTPPADTTMAVNVKSVADGAVSIRVFAANSSGVRQTTFAPTEIAIELPSPYAAGDSISLYHYDDNGVGTLEGTAIATLEGSKVIVRFTISKNFGFQAQSSDLPAPQCFLADAPVLTAKGYRRIDSLRAGDLVKTPSGRLVAIRDVLVRSYAPGRTTNPYVIPAGMFGARERLMISPNHKVAVAGRGMVEARELGLRQWIMREEITYYNLELEEHENMIVAGVEVESLAPVRQVEVTAAQFKKLLAKTNITTAQMLRLCKALPNGNVLVPVTKKTA